MKYRLTFSCAAVALASLSSAQVAYTSFLPGYGWDPNTGYGINGTAAPQGLVQSYATGFESAVTGPVDMISVAVGFLGLGNGRDVRLELYADDGTLQGFGAMLGSWTFVNTGNTTTGTLFQIQNAGAAAVTAGGWYWLHMIAVDADGFHTWMYGDTSILAPALISHDGGQTFNYSPVNNAPALEVLAVPEPMTIGVVAFGLILLAARRR